MAWQTGTANGHLDLVEKIATFLSTDAGLVAASQNWVLLRPPTALPFSAAAPNNRIAFSTRGTSATVYPDPWPSEVVNNNVRLHVTGTLTAPVTGSYTLSLSHEDWVELRIDGVLQIGSYNFNGNAGAVFPTSGLSAATLELTAGDHDIDIRLITRAGAGSNRTLALGWRKPGDPAPVFVPSGNLSSLGIEWGFNASSPLYVGNGTAADFAAVMADTECYLRGPGASESDEIFISLQTISSVSSDKFNVIVRGATGWLEEAIPIDQPGISSSSRAVLLWEDPITYWIQATGRHFIVIAKVSTVYESMYAGLGLPYGLPTEFPYMLVIGTSASNSTLRFSDTTGDHSSFWKPAQLNNGVAGSTSLVMRDTAGTWRDFSNFHADPAGWVYPTNSTNMFTERPTADGSYALTPFVLYVESLATYGELADVYHVSGFGNASENIITIEAQDYLVVQSAHRTGSSDYAAIKLG